MGYDGHYQIICMNGHLSESADLWENFKAHDTDDEVWKCPHCGALAQWINDVNTTNGSYCTCDGDDDCDFCENGIIDGSVQDFEVLEPAIVEKCNLGHLHTAKETVYKIPQDKGYMIKHGK